MKWLLEDWTVLWHAGLSAVILLLVVIAYVRINGLRTFAKMSSIDFVTTITIGSVINSTLMTDNNSIVKGTLVIGALIGVQALFSKLKVVSDWFSKVSENNPLLLMKDGEFLMDNLKSSKVSKSDVIAKLREANAYDMDKVHAVVLETTGDISVLHGEGKPDPKSLVYDDVRLK